MARRTASDQSSQVELTPTQLSGGQWVGPAVRARNGGQDTYLGIYFWNNGSPQLRLYKRNAGTWTQLGSTRTTRARWPPGRQLQLSAVGSTITFLQNGVSRIIATDTSITGGAPGIMTYGQATADNWPAAAAARSAPDVLRRRQRLRALRDGRAPGQRRRRPDADRQRRLHASRPSWPTAPAYARHRQEQPERPDLQRRQRHRHHRLRQRHERRRHLRRKRRLGGQRRLQSPRRLARVELGPDERRRALDRLAGGRRHECNRRRHPDRRDVQQRPVVPDRGHADAAVGRAVGRPGRPRAERRPGHVPRDLLLEQRQPAAAALQAERRHLDPAR